MSNETAVLIVSSLSLVSSFSSLLIMAKTAKELKQAKTEVDAFKDKTARNVQIIKTALEQLEM